MGFGFWCCCPAGCKIVSDDYSTDTDANYTDVAGTGAVASGERSTSSTTFLSIHNTAGNTGHGKAFVRGKVSVSGGSFRVVGAWVDDDNFLFVRVTINGSTSEVTLWERVAGSDSQIGTAHRFTGATNTYYATSVCWDGSAIVVSFDDGTGEKCIGNETYTGEGDQAGYGANISSGTATFDDFLFTKHFIDDPDCPNCGADGDCGPRCNNCNDDHGPSRVQVTITGITEAVCPENDCENINGTYVLARNPPSVDLGCSWIKVHTGSYACAGGVVVAANNYLVSGTRYLSVSVIPAGSGLMEWRTSVTASFPDCFGFDLDLPLHDNSNVRCQSTGASAHISSL